MPVSYIKYPLDEAPDATNYRAWVGNSKSKPRKWERLKKKERKKKKKKKKKEFHTSDVHCTITPPKVERLHPVRTLRSCGCISIFVGRYVRISCIQSFPMPESHLWPDFNSVQSWYVTLAPVFLVLFDSLPRRHYIR